MTKLPLRILIADDEENILAGLGKVLRAEGYEVATAPNGTAACETAEREQPQLALLDLTMPDISGIEVLRRLKGAAPATRVIIMTAYASAETAVEAMKLGALDYLIKPFATEELRLQVRRVADELALSRENIALKRQIELAGDGEIIGEAPEFLAALELARRVAAGDTTVLVIGETGTGKEIVAREIHRRSPRESGPFLALNCGAIPETMLERELFGHEKGAFTGADATRPGLLEAASDGTIFLDEVSELPPALQVKLLRVIEGHDFMRLGGIRPVKVRTRFVAATNRDLRRATSEGKFREDLFHRLNVVAVTLPPLRERGADAVLLARHFLGRLAAEKGKRFAGLAPDADEAIRAYPWPGNVRELRNVIERAVILGEGGTLDAGALRLEPPHAQAGDLPPALSGLPLKEAREAFEKAFIERALGAEGGNVSRTAARIGLDRKNLEDKLRKYGLK